MNTATAQLTPFRRAILELCESEGPITHKDVARNQHNVNIRTAAKQLKALHEMGLLAPVRTAEYALTKAGQQWLDNNRTAL